MNVSEQIPQNLSDAQMDDCEMFAIYWQIIELFSA